MGGGVKRYDIIAFNFKPCPNFNASINCLSNLTSKRVPLKYRPGVVDLRGGGGGGKGSIHPMSHKQQVPPIIIPVYYPFFTSHI